jgi:hypothetical protein
MLLPAVATASGRFQTEQFFDAFNRFAPRFCGAKRFDGK